MIIYACESSAKTASVALCDGARLIAEYTQNVGNTHTETLLPMTESLFSVTGLTPDDVDLFAVSSGPGSFTGVRIGVSHIKGLAFGRGKPCVGVSSLEALAENLSGSGLLVAAVMDARRSQLYCSLFDCSGPVPLRILPDAAESAETFAEKVKSFAQGRPIAPVGDGSALLLPYLSKESFVFLPDRLLCHSAASVASAALRKYESGEYTDDLSLKPVYLRVPQAERERLERIAENEKKI